MIIIFLLLFLIVSCILIFIAKNELCNLQGEINTIHIKGTVRGFLGRFDSNNTLEKKRQRLKKSNII